MSDLKNDSSGVMIEKRGGIIFVSFPVNYKIDLKEAVRHYECYQKLANGGKIFLCTNITNISRVDRSALEYLGQRELLDSYGAVAIVTTKLVSRAIGVMFVKIKKPNVPSKVFATVEEGKQWLTQFLYD